jgi:hypothetical protein
LEVPSNASGFVFVRRQDTLVHLGEKDSRQYIGYRLRILHPNALQLGNLSIAWNPQAGAPIVHTIKVHRDNETIDVLANASFEVLRREDQLDAAKLDGTLTAVLHIPDLRVGDELEVSFTTPVTDPTLANKDSGLLVMLPDPALGRFHMAVSWAKGLQPHIKAAPLMAAAQIQGDDRVDFLFDNPPSITAPKDAPSRYGWQRVVEYSDFADWAEISRHFAPLFAKAALLREGSPLKQEASRIAAAYQTPLDRASAAVKLVQRDVRYIYVGLAGGNLRPATAEETWQRRYGDCKGKTALLLALLMELGIKAEAVLVSNGGLDDGYDARLPNPGLFDHVLVRAQIEGQAYWLDGTLPPVARPSQTPVLNYRWVLPLSTEGHAIEQLVWKPLTAPREIVLYELDVRSGLDQPAKITNTRILRGIEGLQQQAQLSGLTPSQLLTGLRQQMVGDFWQTVEDVKWQYDERAQASVLTISGTGKPDWEDDGDGARSLALPGGGFSPPEKRVRPADQDQTLPYYNNPDFDCQVTTLRLPEAALSGKWTFKPSYDTLMFGKNYYRAFAMRDGAIRMVRGLRVEKNEIDAASAGEDNARISAFDNSKAWVSYTPAKKPSYPHAAKDVPATYEIDWTADDVPCRSPYIKR